MLKQKGLGLPELMISLLLASFISTALVRHYQTIKQQYRHIQAALSETIDLQLVTDLIRNSARNAGFTPCMSVDHLVAVDQRHGEKALIGIEMGESLQINRMSSRFNSVLNIRSDDQLTASTELLFQNHQSIVISDCYHAEVQNIRQIKHTATDQTLILDSPFLFHYHPPVYIGAWVEEIYTIHKKKNNGSALYLGGPHPEELTPYVHALSARLETHASRRLLLVTLGLDRGHQITLETMLRV